MKTTNDQSRTGPVLNGRRAKLPRVEVSTLAVVGALVALVLLSGCASAPVGGDYDAWQYNSNTEYPAIGGPFTHSRP